MPVINLDHAATTCPEAEVVAAVAECMQDCWANPSAAYQGASQARRVLLRTRRTLSTLLRCDPAEIVFTSGGTESNSTALRLAEGRHAVVSAVEHSSVLAAAQLWAREVTLVQPDSQGVIHPEAIEAALRPDTALVSVQWANNETGVRQSVEQIGRLLRTRRIPFHVDAVQAVGHVPVDVACCDMLSLSAHKFYGPRGAGALYVRQGTPVRPLLAGGGQEGGRRSGTENVPAIAGMGVAADMALTDMLPRAERERQLLRELLALLQAGIPGATLLGEGAARLPGIMAVRFPGLPSEIAIAALDGMGIQVSGGAACAASSGEASHVYRAMGLTEEAARQVLRISIGRHTTGEDIRIAAQAMAAVWREHHA
ncbi:MAG: cysteine desulfurase family protein [Aristaeellaceae bacterium]